MFPDVDAAVMVIGVAVPPSIVTVNVAAAVITPFDGNAALPTNVAVGTCGTMPNRYAAGSFGDVVTLMVSNVPGAMVNTSSGGKTLANPTVTNVELRPAPCSAVAIAALISVTSWLTLVLPWVEAAVTVTGTIVGVLLPSVDNTRLKCASSPVGITPVVGKV